MGHFSRMPSLRGPPFDRHPIRSAPKAWAEKETAMQHWRTLAQGGRECKSHIISIPEYPGKVLYGRVQRRFEEIIRHLCPQFTRKNERVSRRFCLTECLTGCGELQFQLGGQLRYRKPQTGHDYGQANSPPVVRATVSQLYLVPVSLRMRSSTGGWVLKRFMRLFPDKGFIINMWAVAGSAFIGICFEAEDILCNAVARPLGLPAKEAPAASAAYSLERDMAI